ncbi:hypothetical protein [Bordetella bronchialis]|nr:hypothetical protein [Bordetella bronchialis]ANN71059.1 hypothetical protein BAU08_06665 [Bordetella bronchialis]
MTQSTRILILATALLAGCATPQERLARGLRTLHGQHLEAAIQRLGVPVGEENVAGMRILVWSTNETRTDTVTQTTRASAGLFKGDKLKDIDASFSVQTPIVVHVHCTIRLRIGKDDIILGSDYNGDLWTCRRYIHALNPDDWINRLEVG